MVEQSQQRFSVRPDLGRPQKRRRAVLSIHSFTQPLRPTPQGRRSTPVTRRRTEQAVRVTTPHGRNDHNNSPSDSKHIPTLRSAAPCRARAGLLRAAAAAAQSVSPPPPRCRRPRSSSSTAAASRPPVYTAAEPGIKCCDHRSRVQRSF